MVMGRYQDARQNHNLKKNNKFFERGEQFKYLGNPVTNQNSLHEDLRTK